VLHFSSELTANLLLALASIVMFGSGFHGTHDFILRPDGSQSRLDLYAILWLPTVLLLRSFRFPRTNAHRAVAQQIQQVHIPLFKPFGRHVTILYSPSIFTVRLS
jgi:hypothetical protein